MKNSIARLTNHPILYIITSNAFVSVAIKPAESTNPITTKKIKITPGIKIIGALNAYFGFNDIFSFPVLPQH